MTDPQPIEFDKVQVGDTVRIERTFPSGTKVITEGEVESVNCGEVSFATGTDYSCDVLPDRYAGTVCAAYLLHRPPTRRAITLDELKDWRAVPIGTKIEFEKTTGEAMKMTLMGRYQFAMDWKLYQAEGSPIYLSDIKEDTLFVIEDSKP